MSGEILLPLAQGRQVDADDGQALVEVRAEDALGDELAKVPVRGRDDAEVHLLRLGLPQARHHPILQHAQQLHLQGQGRVVDLVEEHGASGRRHELPVEALRRAGEGPLRVAEELALHELIGDGRAVDGHEAPATALAPGVEQARGDFLARACLAGDEHGHGRAGRAGELVERGTRGGAPRHEGWRGRRSRLGHGHLRHPGHEPSRRIRISQPQRIVGARQRRLGGEQGRESSPTGPEPRQAGPGRRGQPGRRGRADDRHLSGATSDERVALRGEQGSQRGRRGRPLPENGGHARHSNTVRTEIGFG